MQSCHGDDMWHRHMGGWQGSTVSLPVRTGRKGWQVKRWYGNGFGPIPRVDVSKCQSAMSRKANRTGQGGGWYDSHSDYSSWAWPPLNSMTRAQLEEPGSGVFRYNRTHGFWSGVTWALSPVAASKRRTGWEKSLSEPLWELAPPGLSNTPPSTRR
jgi:hypothetical protein